MGRGWWWALAMVGLVAAAATLAEPLVFQADDSWFYLVIGRNIAEGSGITFNGVVPTNGFQPLWQVIVAATMGIAEVAGVESAVGQARMVLVVGWLCLAAGLLLLATVLERLRVPSPAVFGALLAPLVFLGGGLGTVGSEANLVFLLASASLWLILDLIENPTRRGRAVQTGVILGLLVLGRLDTGFFAAAGLAAVALAARAEPSVRLRAAVVAGLTACVVVVPYLLWNQVRFGHLLPIAGAIKLDRSSLWFEPEAVGPTGWLIGALALGAGVAAFAGRRPARLEFVAWAVPMAGGLVSSAVYFSWSPSKLTDLAWYLIPQLLAFTVALALALTRLARWQPGLVRVGAMGAGLAVLVLIAGFLGLVRLQGPNRDFWLPVASFSEAVGEEVPADEVIATVDYPGVLAAYSNRPVLALDGLTGDFAFQDDLRDLGVGCALGKRGVAWLVVDDADRLIPLGPDDSDGWRVEVTSWLHRVDAGDLLLAPQDQVLADGVTGLSLWRVDPACGE